MNCSNCGASLKENSSFCSKCGYKVELSEISAVENKKKKNNKPFVGIVLGLLLLLCIVGVYLFKFTNLFNHKINLDEYIEVEFQGYNTVGHATVDFDFETFKSEHEKYLKDNMDQFLRDISFSLDKDNKLSNNDSIELKWNFNDEKLNEEYKVKIIASNQTFNVVNLEELTEFDPFEGVEIEFSGISPMGSALIVNLPEGNGLSYSFAEYRNNYKNGDVIKVNALYGNYSEDEYAEEYGCLPSVLSKEYEVNGLDEYVVDYKDISDSIKQDLLSKAENAVKLYASQEYENILSVSDFSNEGEIFYHYEDEMDVDLGDYIYDKNAHDNVLNALVILIKGRVTSEDEHIEGTDVYYPVCFSNFINKAGDINYEDIQIIAGQSKFNGLYKGAALYTRGYTNPIVCYRDIVEKRSNKVEIECMGDFSKFTNNKSIKEINDVTDEINNQIKDDASDIINSYVAKYNSSNFKYWNFNGNLQYVGSCILTAKNNKDGINSNKYYVIFSEDMSYKDKKTLTVYFPVCYEGVYILENGEAIISDCLGIVGKTNTYSYYKQIGTQDTTQGYLDIADMEDGIIFANASDYDYEYSEELKKLFYN